MKRYTYLIAIILTLVVCVVFVGNTRNGSEHSPDVTLTPTTIGVILPLSGDMAFIGEDMKRGIDLAGATWPNTTFLFEDSRADASGMVTAYHKLTLEHPTAIIAAGTGVEALIPLAEKDNIPLFLTVSSASGLPAQGSYIFRYFTNADTDTPVMAAYAVDTLGEHTFGTLYLQDQFGIDYNRIFSDTVRAHGGTVLASESFNYGDFDLRSQLTKLKSANVDAIYLIGLDFQLIPALQQIEELGIDAQVLSLGSIATASSIEQGGEAIDDVYLTAFCTDGSPESYVADFKRTYSTYPGFFSEIGYDMTKMLHDAHASNNVVDGLLAVRDYHANTGIVSADATGEIMIPMCVKKITDGKIYNTVTGNYSNY